MFGSAIIETALALVMVYLLLSLLCSGLNEVILGHMRGLRAKLLEQFLRRLLGCPEDKHTDLTQFANKVLKHPLVTGLTPTDRARPSYIPPLTFVSAVLNELMSGQESNGAAAAQKRPNGGEGNLAVETAPKVTPLLIGNLDIVHLRAGISRQTDERVKKLFAALLQGVDSMSSARERIEHWFNDSMVRLSGTYKRKAQFWLHIQAIIVVLALNIDTIEIARQFMANSTQRSALVALAEETAHGDRPGTPTNTVQLAALARQIKDLTLPIGWGDCFPGSSAITHAADLTMSTPSCPTGFQGWLLKAAGLLLSAVAVSFGAPFWFDLLNRITNLRAGGRPPSTEPEKKPSS